MHKELLKTIIYIILGSFITIGCHKQNQNMMECSIQLDETDSLLFTTLTQIYKEYATKPDSLWNKEYRLDLEPLILCKSKFRETKIQYTYYINSGKYIDPSDKHFQKIIFPNNPYLKDVYKTTLPKNDTMMTSYPIMFTDVEQKNKKTLAFRYFKEMFEKQTFNVNSKFEFFMPHEAFHLYKQAKWTYDKEGRDVIFPDEYPHNQENYDLIRKEYTLLDKALTIKDKNKLIPVMKQWLVIRETRYTKWPILIKETYSEAIEGTATYVTYKYADLLHLNYGFNVDINEQKHTFVQHFDDLMKAPSPTEPDASGMVPNKMSKLERADSYDKGAALGYILDILDPDWKHKIDKDNKTQYEIIKEAITN